MNLALRYDTFVLELAESMSPWHPPRLLLELVQAIDLVVKDWLHHVCITINHSVQKLEHEFFLFQGFLSVAAHFIDDFEKFLRPIFLLAVAALKNFHQSILVFFHEWKSLAFRFKCRCGLAVDSFPNEFGIAFPPDYCFTFLIKQGRVHRLELLFTLRAGRIFSQVMIGCHERQDSLWRDRRATGEVCKVALLSFCGHAI